MSIAEDLIIFKVVRKNEADYSSGLAGNKRGATRAWRLACEGRRVERADTDSGWVLAEPRPATYCASSNASRKSIG